MKVKVKVAQVCPTFLRPYGLYSLWNSLGQNTEVGSLSLLQRIFPTQEYTKNIIFGLKSLPMGEHKKRLFESKNT